MLTAARKRYASFLKLLPLLSSMFNQSRLPIAWSLPWIQITQMSFFLFYLHAPQLDTPSPASFPSNPQHTSSGPTQMNPASLKRLSQLEPDRGNVAWGTH